ncbi:MAG: hypothetical protein B1H13_14940 [Desulfobacteraceae bacterium 4484_190.3]|nr:MAG: hypothetical protein B1H13_14940 [Desulfobacteraceae bacterium 4484_190.3]
MKNLGSEQRDKAIEQVQKGFSLAKQHGYNTFFFFTREMMAKFCLLARQEAIEKDFVSSFIRRWKVVPQNACVPPELWPWPVRISVLGLFRVNLNGEIIVPSSRRQGKPLELLQVLISMGGNRVAEATIQDILWPDSEGDKQSRVLKTTLHRLRKLLGDKEAIVHKNKTLSLNPVYCWIDAIAFKELVEKAVEAARGENTDQSMEMARNALDLYQGPFLWALADQIYQEAISRDPDCEMYYQRRMECLLNAGNANQALRVYEQCKRNLERIFGEKPSPQTKPA